MFTILGFLGDKIGLKPILLIAMVGMAISGTCIDLTPRYREYYKYAQALATAKNSTRRSYVLRSIQWPINSPDCLSSGDQDLALCKNAPPVVDPKFYDSIIEYMDCKDGSENSVEIEILDTSFFKYPSNNNLAILEMADNDTFCDLYTDYESSVKEENIYCQIKDNPYVGYCFNTEGSHAAMFYTYLFLRISQAVFDNTMFSLMYGTAMHLVKEYNGDFSMVLLWNSVAGLIGPLIAGVLVEDSIDPAGKTFKHPVK